MGNGPSLRSFLQEDEALRDDFDLMAVNFAAITPEFFSLRPSLYILADPHFFESDSKDHKVITLWETLKKVDWEMTLFLPVRLRKNISSFISTISNTVRISWYNLTPVEGGNALSRFLIKSAMGMPRPRNVLIPAIMNALRAGYKRIFLVGADHTWSQSLWVDDKNRVVSVQPHFYKDNEEEEKRVAAEYAGYHLHDILNSLTIAFRSYFDIADYIAGKDVKIYNATPGSFIDAFPRCDYAQMKMLSEK